MNDRIIELRKKQNWTQDEFAERMRISKNYVSLIENGKKIPSDRLISDICREFGVNEEWLRNGTLPIEKTYSTGVDEYSEISTMIGEKDPKAKQAIIDYWKLTEPDKKLFWSFMERFILGSGG